MTEYIEREALLDEIGKLPNVTEWCFYEDDVVDMARAIPAADVVEVVRCKDCMYWLSGENEEEKWEWCVFHNYGTGPHVFCSFGERRDEQ